MNDKKNKSMPGGIVNNYNAPVSYDRCTFNYNMTNKADTDIDTDAKPQKQTCKTPAYINQCLVDVDLNPKIIRLASEERALRGKNIFLVIGKVMIENKMFIGDLDDFAMYCKDNLHIWQNKNCSFRGCNETILALKTDEWNEGTCCRQSLSKSFIAFSNKVKETFDLEIKAIKTLE